MKVCIKLIDRFKGLMFKKEIDNIVKQILKYKLIKKSPQTIHLKVCVLA